MEQVYGVFHHDATHNGPYDLIGVFACEDAANDFMDVARELAESSEEDFYIRTLDVR